MTSFRQIAVPAQVGVRLDEEPQPAQDLAGQRGQVRGEKGPILGCESHSNVSAELAFKDGDLVTQDENLRVLVPIAHGEQPQRGKSVRDLALRTRGDPRNNLPALSRAEPGCRVRAHPAWPSTRHAPFVGSTS
ncbi:hypothetical protein [Nonomuraea solani]|uniref:hypothetical protein n=1 Tax=Nonomuraea solani TaxID=1144553 RepID=UPI00190E69F5|nr:hypothetical protein [Nonomuraea solani]